MGLLIPASDKKRHQCDYPRVAIRGDVYWCDCGAKWKCHGNEWLRHFRWFGPPKYLLDSEGGAGPKPSEARVSKPKPWVNPDLIGPANHVSWKDANGRPVSPPRWAGRRVPPTMEPPPPPPPPKYATGGVIRGTMPASEMKPPPNVPSASFAPPAEVKNANEAIRKARKIYSPRVANAIAWSLGNGAMFDTAQAELIKEVLADADKPPSFLDTIHSYAQYENGLALSLTDAKIDRSTVISDSPFLIEVHFDASSEVMGISIVRLDTVL